MMHYLEEDLQTFSVKDVIVNILGFVDENYLTLPCGGKPATDKGKEWICLRANKALFTKTGGGTGFNPQTVDYWL